MKSQTVYYPGKTDYEGHISQALKLAVPVSVILWLVIFSILV